MEWPKRARTADWENGVLTLDGEKKFDIPKLTAEIMERLAGYTLVGFHVKGYTLFCGTAKPGSGCLCKAITSEFLCNASKIDQVARHISLRKPMNSLAILAVV